MKRLPPGGTWEKEQGECFECGKNSTLKCSKCKVVFFCGKKCMQKSWKAHKPNCKPWVEPKEGETPPAVDASILKRVKQNKKQEEEDAFGARGSRLSVQPGIANRWKEHRRAEGATIRGLRGKMLRVVNSEIFSFFVLLLVVTNWTLYFLEMHIGLIVFAIVYSLEFMLRFYVQRFFGTPEEGFEFYSNKFPGGYFRSGYNIIAFGVVIASWVGVANNPDLYRLQLLRGVHLVYFWQVRSTLAAAMIRTLTNAVIGVMNVAVLLAMFLFVYGIVGVHLFEKSLRHRCYSAGDIALTVPGDMCSMGNGMAPTCPSGQVCVEGPWTNNPEEGLLSFDHIGWAMLTLFSVITLDDMSNRMYELQDTVSEFVWLYFVSFILLGAWFAMELVTAALFSTYSVEMEKKRKYEEKDRYEKYVEQEQRWAETRAEKYKAFLAEAEKNHHNSSQTFKSNLEGIRSKFQEAKFIRTHSLSGQGIVDLQLAKHEGNSTSRLPFGNSLSSLNGSSNGSAAHKYKVSPRLPGTAPLDAIEEDSEAEEVAGDGKAGKAEVSIQVGGKAAAEERRQQQQQQQQQREEEKAKFASLNMRAKPNDQKERAVELKELEQQAAGTAFVTLSEQQMERKALSDDMVRARMIEAEANSQYIKVESYLELKPSCFRHVYKIVDKSLFFYLGVCFVVLFSIGILIGLKAYTFDDQALLRATQSTNAVDMTLLYLQLVLVLVMVAEMVLKTIAYGPSGVMGDALHSLDFACVLIALVGIFSPYVEAKTPLSSLRVALVFRVLGLLRPLAKIRAFRMSLMAIGNSLQSLFVAIVLLMALVATFAEFGYWLFGGKFSPGFRADFDSFYSAAITTFQVLTGDQWTSVMMEAMRSTEYASCVFFILIVIYGQYVVISVFVAVLLDAYSSQTNEKQQELDLIAECVRWRYQRVSRVDAARQLFQRLRDERQQTKQANNKKLQEMELYHRELDNYQPPKESPLRQFLFRVLSHRAYKVFIILCTLGCLASVASRYPGMSDTRTAVLLGVDAVLVVVFSLDQACILVARGFREGRFSYARKPWNWFDLVVVLLSCAALFAPVLAPWMALRALGLLRHFRRTQTVLSSLIYAAPSITIVIVYSVVVWVVFALVNSVVFEDKFGACNDVTVADRAACTSSYTETNLVTPATWSIPVGDPSLQQTVQREWSVPFLNFDGFGRSWMSMLHLLCMEWVDPMRGGMDAVGVFKQPQEDHNMYFGIYFVMLCTICSMFCLNLFVGTLLDSFSRIKEQVSGAGLRSLKQQQQHNLDQLLRKNKLTVSITAADLKDNKPRMLIFQLVNSKLFNPVCYLLIVLNALFLALRGLVGAQAEDALIAFSSAFIYFSWLETVLRCFANGRAFFTHYGFDLWDVFVNVAATSLLVAGAGPAFSILRVFRLVRMFNWFKKRKRLLMVTKLLQTLELAVRELVFVGLVIFAFFFLFACIGVEFLGKVRWVENGFSDKANFSTFGSSLLVLFRLASRDDSWNLHYGATIEPPLCEKGVDCGQGATASLFFWVFTIFGSFILVQIYASVMVASFQEIQKGSLDASGMQEAINQWSEVWSRYDKQASGSIKCSDFVKMMSDAKPPFGFGSHVLPRVVYMRRMRQQRLNIHPPGAFASEWSISYRDTLQALAKKVAKMNVGDAADVILPWTSENRNATMDQWYAAQTIQIFCRKRLRSRSPGGASGSQDKGKSKGGGRGSRQLAMGDMLLRTHQDAKHAQAAKVFEAGRKSAGTSVQRVHTSMIVPIGHKGEQPPLPSARGRPASKVMLDSLPSKAVTGAAAQPALPGQPGSD